MSNIFFCPSLSAQSSKTSGFNQDFENNQELIDCGPVGMHRKSIEAAEHLKSGGEDSGNDHNGSGNSPHHNHHQGGPTSSESGQESQDGMGPSSSTSKSSSLLLRYCTSSFGYATPSKFDITKYPRIEIRPSLPRK